MYPAGHHPLYPHTKEDRAEILKRIGITEKQLKEDEESIVDWLQKQPHLAEAGIYANMPEFFIISAKGSVERAKQRIDCFYRCRLNHPEFFKDRIKLLNNIDRPIWSSEIMAPMPNLYNGERVTVTRFMDIDNFKMEDCILKVFMVGDVRLANEFTVGDTWIIDLKDVTLNHIILKLNPIVMAKANWIIHEGIGLKIFGIHMINCSIASIGQALLNLLRPFLSKKILDRIHFHENLDDLHKCIPKAYLPMDYGGYLPSMEDFRGKHEKLMRSEKTKQFLIEACKLVSDESKRPRSTYNEDCLTGNFRNLNVD